GGEGHRPHGGEPAVGLPSEGGDGLTVLQRPHPARRALLEGPPEEFAVEPPARRHVRKLRVRPARGAGLRVLGLPRVPRCPVFGHVANVAGSHAARRPGTSVPWNPHTPFAVGRIALPSPL